MSTDGSRTSGDDRPLTAARPDLRGVRVLVVDDDAASAKLLAVVLGAEGCEIRVAYSAEEALDILGGFRPRAIVLDLILPLMSGLLFAQRLKSDAAMRDLVIIAVSAVNGPGAERAALGAGCAAFIRKPINALTFAQLLLESLGPAT
jgi:CheY-like chemotaxis protein